MSYRFDRDTAIVDAGDGRFTADVTDNWTIAGTPNGGYVTAIAAAALAAATGRAWPASATTHFLRPTTPNASAEVDVTIIRTGRTRTLADAVLTQDGTERLRTRAWMSDPIPSATMSHRHPSLDPPELARPEDCIDRSQVAQGVALPILDSVEVRVDPQFVADGEAGGGQHAEVRGWIRFADGRPPDVACLGLFCDAFPPPVFSLLGTGIGWVPTL